MESTSPDRAACRLSELNSLIKSVLGSAFPEACWITAEIAECKCNQKGHCYLELVEKEEDRVIAQAKANIWVYEYRKISQKFQASTGESLRPGMKIMLLAAVTFHEVYGLSLNVRDIDPAYTLGEMARRKKEIIERLKKEGLIDRNKNIPLPLVPQKVAVISSPTAAGYGDFSDQLDANPYGYAFVHFLFPALMQGEGAEKSILSALNRVRKKRELFDVVVIIRGGGSAVDLSCFDSYELGAAVAGFPLPVITGIGHEKDDTVVDIAAHTKMKTPTAVAEFLISGVRGFEERIVELMNRMCLSAERSLKDARYRLDAMSRRLMFVPVQIASLHSSLAVLQNSLRGFARQFLRKEDSRIDSLEQAVRLLDPSRVLGRGYSITRRNGKIVKDASLVRKGDVIETTLRNGTLLSTVGQKKEREVTSSEQEQTAYLLPGFD